MIQNSRVISSTAFHCLFLLSALLLSSVDQVSCSSSSTQIRGATPKNSHGLPNGRRLHPIRRIYGPENAEVRRELHKLETESNSYWRTGIRPDPSFKVLYDNHPLDPESHRRLQNGTNTTENYMKPMRIGLDSTSLDSQRDGTNDAKIDFIKNEILPRMTNFWSEALSVVPVSGNLVMDSSVLINGYCGDSEFSQVPQEHLTTGMPDTDLILYVSGTPSTRFCGPTTLAVAVACNFDQYDRPTAGAINFCIDQIQLDSEGNAHPSVIEDNVDVAIHEAGHVLGMSSNSYRFFWNPITAEPRTPRPFKAKTVTCVDGSVKTTYLPAENTLQFLTSGQGVRAAFIVTEKVKTVVQNQFNCEDLEGAQLENQPTGSSCTGDHFDERSFYPEVMSGVISPSTNVFSPLTLALMEDSGWYAANYTKSSVSPWGHGVGCDFVRKPCLDLDANGVTTVPDYGRGFFCTSSSERGCSPTHNYKMACFFRDYSLSSSGNPPEHFQYFSDPALGGLKTADYCPVFGDNYKSNVQELDCRNPENSDGIDWQGTGETFGPTSSCFETNKNGGVCYNTQCINSEFKLKVQMQGKWFTCEEDFQEIDVPSNAITDLLQRKIICPRLSSVCPDMFCPANCAGRGKCNYDAVVNGIARPKCECFDETDTSPGCTDSLILDGKYIEDSSGLENIDVKGLFDDLVAVFTDNPSSWSTASWCWASGLFGLFLLLLLCICSTFWPKKRRRRRAERKRGRRSRQSSVYDDEYDGYGAGRRKGYY